MYKIKVVFMDGEEKEYTGNFILEGNFVRINYDHDNNKQTPQRTMIIPSHLIQMIDCEVIQSGVR